MIARGNGKLCTVTITTGDMRSEKEGCGKWAKTNISVLRAAPSPDSGFSPRRKDTTGTFGRVSDGVRFMTLEETRRGMIPGTCW